MESFIGEYQQKLDRHELFTCYHASDNPHKLVPKIKFTSDDVLHSMLWPSLLFAFALSCAVILVFDFDCYWPCRGLTNKYERKPKKVIRYKTQGNGK